MLFNIWLILIPFSFVAHFTWLISIQFIALHDVMALRELSFKFVVNQIRYLRIWLEAWPLNLVKCTVFSAICWWSKTTFDSRILRECVPKTCFNGELSYYEILIEIHLLMKTTIMRSNSWSIVAGTERSINITWVVIIISEESSVVEWWVVVVPNNLKFL